MRLDKFLKVARVIKQRNRAKEMCDMHAVKINGTAAKASHEVVPGDFIEAISGDRKITARVIDVPEGNVSKQRSRELITIIEDRLIDEV
jgi:ribosomal 50S subunit-recycling heat shock protein